MRDRGLDPAEPVATAQRDGSAHFCFRESLIAWLTCSVRQNKVPTWSIIISVYAVLALGCYAVLSVLIRPESLADESAIKNEKNESSLVSRKPYRMPLWMEAIGLPLAIGLAPVFLILALLSRERSKK